MRALLIATYEMGRQPFGLASPAAWLREAGVDVRCLDVTQEPFREELVVGDVARGVPPADLVGFHLPMHTATRLAVPLIQRIRGVGRHVTLCAYGLYAPLNAAVLQELGVHEILGGEFEADLVRIATAAAASEAPARDVVPRLRFRVPDRTTLPHLSRYARVVHGGRQRVVGYTESSRGCKHRCRHCPVVPVYDGQFRVVPLQVVLDDVEWQMRSGAEHITFGDPDFFNGIRHAMSLVTTLRRRFPRLTYDVTVKVEHLLRHRDCLSVLSDTGCLFVTSAAESFDDDILRRLGKGHTTAEVETVVELMRHHGVPLVPTFVAFSPWTTVEGYRRFLEALVRLQLVDYVAPIQLALRLLVPHGSALLEHQDVRDLVGPFDPQRLVYPWVHSDPGVEALCGDVVALVERQGTAGRREVFDAIWNVTHDHLGQTPVEPVLPLTRAEVPYLNEPWYC